MTKAADTRQDTRWEAPAFALLAVACALGLVGSIESRRVVAVSGRLCRSEPDRASALALVVHDVLHGRGIASRSRDVALDVCAAAARDSDPSRSSLPVVDGVVVTGRYARP